MSYSKLNRIGLAATAVMLLAIGAVQGCSSSDDSQATPTAGTSAVGGKGGSSSTSGGTNAGGGKAGMTGGGGTTSGGTTPVSEGGAAGDTGGNTCEPAEDHGEAAYLAAHGNKLPTL